MNLSEIIGKAVFSPEVIWGDNVRQANKLRKRVSRLIFDYRIKKDHVDSLVLSVAQARLNNKSLTVFFPNIGSSGSHLIQDAVSRSWDSIPLGEVYVPPDLVPIIKKMTEANRQLFMEAWHLLHAMDYSQFFNLNSIIINTVHNATLSRFSEWAGNHKSCLIVRNPVDVVISRSFRKDEYRKYVSSSESDFDYTMRNVGLVKNFYEKAISANYSRKIAFEDIISNPEKIAMTIKSMMNPLLVKKDFMEALTHSLGDGKATNQFSGNTIVIPDEYKELVKKEMYSTLLLLGYKI